MDLVVLGEAARHRASVGALVRGLPRRGEPHRARRHGLAHDAAHRLGLGGGRGALLAADREQPQRRVPDERADVEALGARVDGGKVVGVGLEAPVDALVEGLQRHALDVLQGADDDVAVLGAGGRDAEAAVAHDDAGHAVPAGRGEVAVPEDLRVVVGVDVDEAGRERQAVQVDDLGARARRQLAGCADGGDAVGLDGDVVRDGRAAGAVHQRGAAQQQVHLRSDRSRRAVRSGPGGCVNK
nr:hypothetical protein [Actinomadura sp. CNU-125]